MEDVLPHPPGSEVSSSVGGLAGVALTMLCVRGPGLWMPCIEDCYRIDSCLNLPASL